MTTTLPLLPLLLVLGLLAAGRAAGLRAGLAGLAATFAVSALLLLPEGGPASLAMMWQREVPAGMWLAWQGLAMIARGMFFPRCSLARQRPAEGDEHKATPRHLWSVCFLLGPFAEAVTGF